MGRPGTFALAKSPGTPLTTFLPLHKPTRPKGSDQIVLPILGYVASFLCLALAKAAPSTVALRGHAELSRFSGLMCITPGMAMSTSPASRQTPPAAFSSENSRRPNTLTVALRGAKGVERTATQARVHRKREGKPEATKQENCTRQQRRALPLGASLRSQQRF